MGKSKLSTKYIQKSISIPEVFRLICDQMVLVKFVQYDGNREIRYKYNTLIYITNIIKSILEQEFSMSRISWKDLLSAISVYFQLGKLLFLNKACGLKCKFLAPLFEESPLLDIQKVI